MKARGVGWGWVFAVAAVIGVGYYAYRLGQGGFTGSGAGSTF